VYVARDLADNTVTSVNTNMHYPGLAPG